MSNTRRWLLRLRNVFRQDRAEDELAREITSHLGLIEDDYRRQGLTGPEARLAARKAMNGVAHAKDLHRDARSFPWIEDFGRDVWHAVRMMGRARAWTAVIVLSLALGIGANTAIFGAVNGLLVRKLPVADPDSLVRLRHAGPNQMATSSNDYGFSARDAHGRRVLATFSYPMFRHLLEANQTMSALVACAPIGRLNVIVGGEADLADGFAATGNYFQMLGVGASLGRTFLPDDDQPAAAAVAVISYRYWQSRFGGDPAAIHRIVRVNDVPVAIVGVLPPAFIGIQRVAEAAPDITVPLWLTERLPSASPAETQRLARPTMWWLQVMGRLRPGSTPEQVEGNLAGVFQSAARAGLDEYLSGLSDEERSRAHLQNRIDVPNLMVDWGGRGLYDVPTDQARTIAVLGGVVGLVLLLVCANVANLLLSRSTARQKELAVRRSLGASRGRLVRQLLAESLLLATVGGTLGLAIGYWSRPLLPGPAGRAFVLDWRLLLFAAALTTLAGIVFGAAPAFRASQSIDVGLKATGRGVAVARSRLGASLLVAQVAISLVLLVGAGLFLQTVQNLRRIDVGFDADNVLLFRVDPGLIGYGRQEAAALYAQIRDRVAEVPGVRAVALSHMALLAGGGNTSTMFFEGGGSNAAAETYRLVVSPGFFDTLQIPIVAGRGFSDRDDASAPTVALINRTAALKYFQGRNPVGQRFGSSAEEDATTEIVGVVGDARYERLRDDPPPTFYLSYRQAPPPRAFFEVRTAVDPLSLVDGLRNAVRLVDPNLPLATVTTQAAAIEERLLQERLLARAYTLFGGLAAIVAAVGLFGLMSYSVARRTNEIGIRMTLGAQRRRVLGLVLGESLALVAIGIVTGLVGAFAAGRIVASQLFGVASTDAATAIGAAVLMLLVSAIAGYLPARRASRVDPMVALRSE